MTSIPVNRCAHEFGEKCICDQRGGCGLFRPGQIETQSGSIEKVIHMTRITDEMVEAALDVWFPMYPKGWQREDISKNYRICMRTALEAALAVAPKDETSARQVAWNAAEASVWPELELAGEKKP